MFRWFEKSIPYSTSKTEPLEYDFKVDTGFIVQWIVILPNGCAGLVGFQVLLKNIALLPRTRDAYFKGDDIKTAIQEYYPIPADKTVLRVKAYNEDSRYNHTIIIGCNILPADATQQFSRMADQLSAISAALGLS